MSVPRPPVGPVGYAWIRDRLGVPSFLGTREGRLANVNAIVRQPDGSMLVPTRLAPPATLLAHVLFALKHEEVNLHLLSVGLKRVLAQDLEAEFARTPNGTYIRIACYLWEQFNQQALKQAAEASIVAAYVQVFSPSECVTGVSRRNSKWRVDFNGLGDLTYCPVVRLTPDIKALLEEDLLGQAREFAQSTSKEMLDRALNWAYLSETEGSFAIEGEVPTQSKAAAFADMLKHAHDPRTLSEEYLCDLQNLAIANPLDKAVQFRTEQNRLQRGGRGAAGVTYVPPRPDLADALMGRLMQLANEAPTGIDPLVHAAVVSFGFVFIHPFMDGNGRPSRFLIHHCLGQSGQLPRAFVLPVSMAMRREEESYLEALTSFSRPARDLCAVTWIGGDDYTYEWSEDADEAFRYVDTTESVAFVLRMAKVALAEDLRRETEFLMDFDRVFKSVDDRFDVRGSDLSSLILFAFEQGGRISKHRRKQYADRIPAETIDAIEAAVRACLEPRQQEAATGPEQID
jgi:Fic family protein